MTFEALSNHEIDYYYKGVKQYGGCYSKDLLPKKMANKGYIINMEDSNAGGGTHWVCAMSINPHETVYFDSFGQDDAALDIEAFLKTSSKKKTLIRNTIDLQHLTTDSCGQFCIFFINNAILGKTFKQTMAYFTHNPVINEHLLRQYFGQESFTEPTLRYSIERHQLNGAGVKDVLKYIRNKANSVKNTAIRVKDRVVNALSGGHRMNFSPHVRSFLSKYGDLRIMNIKVCRKPIHALINTLLNWVSLGTFERNLRAMDYDKAMHLYLLFQLENGTVLKFEKNEVIAVYLDKWNQSKEVESIELGSHGNTLNKFLQTGLESMGPERYFIYDSKTQNCQYWVQWNLRANNLWNDNVNNFVMQDAVAIYKNLGWLEKANRFITDSASKLDNAIYGASVRAKPKRKIIS